MGERRRFDRDGACSVLGFVNRQHDWDFRLAGQLPGGHQTGAFLLRAPDGRRAVLKCSPVSSWADRVLRAAGAVERARAHGWPTPAWLGWGVTPEGYPYQVQEFAPGAPMRDLGLAEAALLIDLVARQEGADPDPGHDWSQYVTRLVFDGPPDGWSRIRALGVNGTAVLDAYRRLCAPYRACVLPAGDLVHGDLSTHNVLVEQGRISAVLDVEAVGSGTRVIDLTALLREGYLWRGHPRALAWLREAAEAVAGREVMLICAASTVLLVLDFVIQHAPHELDRSLRGAIRLADDLRHPTTCAG